MEFNSRKAIYYQIFDLVCEKILLGKHIEEERLDSVRDLAVSLEVNPNTVMRAYSYLQDESIIFNKRGIGYFVSLGARELILKLNREKFIGNELPEIFKLSMLYGIEPLELKELYQSYLKERNNEVK